MVGMKSKSRKHIGQVVLCALVAGGIGSVLAAQKPEDTVAYRQGILRALGWNVGPMGAMVKGEVPFDAQRFAFLAGRTAALAPMALEGFTPDTQDAKSHARPALWKNMDDFKARMDKLQEATAALATVAQGGDEAGIKRQFGETVQVCKGCHDEYREKQ
jgi:cytochrome c556